MMEITDNEKSVLWVTGALEQLKTWGIISSMEFITPKGIAMWDQLDAEGFRPTDQWILATLVEILHEETLASELYVVFCLVVKFRDEREDMLRRVQALKLGDDDN